MSQSLTSLKLLARPGLAAGTSLVGAYERAFARTVLADGGMPCLAFWRGRVALWTILRAIGVQEGDEVIIPAFTCEMVPIAVRFAGARCVYVDVGQGRFNAETDQVADAVTARTRAVLCQHTYGLAQPVRDIRRIAQDHGAVLIEDCCQFVGFGAAGEVGTTGGASFFSMQWNKPFSTGLGGMAAFADRSLYTKAGEMRSTFSHAADRRRARSLAQQVLLYALTVRPTTREWITGIYRWAQNAGLVKGTTEVEEYGDAMPPDYLAGALNAQAVLGLEQLRSWPQNVRHRRRLTEFYLERLAHWGVNLDFLPPRARREALWGVPLLLENKFEILQRAGRAGLPIGTWFTALPRHIAADSARRYHYQIGQCPRSERLFLREVRLLTGPAVTPGQGEGALELLQKYGRPVDHG